jgi:NitT/TauT family transport system ATP-binding protein
MRTAVIDSTTTSQEPLIRIQGLAKSYPTADGKPVLALSELDLDIVEGTFVSVVGPSGCGKSTLLNILAGLLGPSHGHVALGGTQVEGPRPDVGVMFQQPVLLPWLTIMQNVMLPVKVQRRRGREYAERAAHLLELVGLTGFEGRYPNELSGGMQQRVGIARALVTDPRILLMDEPFGALDALTREQMNDELQRIWMEQRKTVFFITHSIPEAVYLSDRVLVMSARPGRILADLPIDIPRARSLETTTRPDFVARATEIRGLLNAKGGLD